MTASRRVLNISREGDNSYLLKILRVLHRLLLPYIIKKKFLLCVIFFSNEMPGVYIGNEEFGIT